MKKRNYVLRVGCVLLCLVMAAGMLPAAAFAEELTEPTVVTNLSLINAPAPAAGEVCVPAADTETEDFAVEEVGVFDITDAEEEVSAGSEFCVGRTYRIQILVSAAEGFVFDAPEKMTARINGQAAEVEADEEDSAKLWVILDVAVPMTMSEPAPEVTAVAVTPAAAEVETGGTLQLTATVTVTGETVTTVIWSVTGGTGAATGISEVGLLTVGSDETAETLTVVAAATADNTKTASAVIKVKAPAPTYTLTYDGNGEGVTGVPAAVTRAEATIALSEAQPVREGYTFLGWADTADATVPVSGTSVVIPEETKTLTLYTVWEKNPEGHVHTLGKVTGIPATCTDAGLAEHWKCTDTACGKLFSDEAGTTEITDAVIPAGHTLADVALVEPTYTTPGTKAHKHCSACDKDFIGTEEVTEELLVIPQLIIVTNTTADVSAGALEKADDGLGNVVLDLNSAVFVGSAAGKIESVKLPVSALGAVKLLTIHMADGSVELDQMALAEVAEQAGCARVTLSLNEIGTTGLNLWQRNALRTYDVVRVVNISLMDCEGNKLNTAEQGGFGAGTVKLMVYDIAKTKNNIYYKYIPEDADAKTDLKGIAGTYSSVREVGTMHLLNTGDHAVVRLKADTSNPATGDTSNIKLWIGLMAGSAVALAALVVFVTAKNRKKR